MMKIFITSVMLVVLCSPVTGFQLSGELDVYTSAAFSGDYFPRNALSAVFSTSQGVGLGQVEMMVELRSSSVDEDPVSFSIKELSYTKFFDIDGALVSEIALLAGYTRFTWGKSDGLRFIDVLNPLYLNFSIFDDVEELKTGRLALTAYTSFGNFSRFGVLFLPKPEKSILENYPLFPAQMQSLYDMADADPDFNLYEGEFSGSLSESSVGLHFETSIAGIDTALYFYHGYHNEPVFSWGIDMSDMSQYVTREYRRITMFGLDFERPVGSLVFRGEVGLFTAGRMVALVDEADIAADLAAGGDGLREKTHIDYVVGFDTLRFIIPDLYLNLQYGASIITDHEDALIRDRVEHVCTIKLEYSFVGDTLKAGVAGMVMPDRGFLINPELSIRLDPGADLILGAYILSTDQDDYMFGNYDDLDFVYARFSVLF